MVSRAGREDDIARIVDLRLARIGKRLAEKRVSLSVTPKAKQLLAKRGFDPAFGARPLKRTLQQLILDPLALKIIEGEVPGDSTVVIDAKGQRIVFKHAETAEPVPAETAA